jgi:ankyrin repeat protein
MRTRFGLLGLPELDKIVLSFLKLPGVGANKNKADFEDQTPLIVACKCGRAEVAKLLLGAAGVDTNKVDDDGMSAFHHAVLGNNLEIVRFLVNAGADCHVRDREGHTALDLCAHIWV